MYLQDSLRNMTYEQLEKVLPFPVCEFKTKPYRHQLASFMALLSKPGFMASLEMGLGKSKVVIDVCDFLRSRGHIRRTLIVTLNSAANNFGRQIEAHSNSEYLVLKGTRQQRVKLSKERTDYSIINYEGLAVMCSGWKEYDDEGISRRKRKLSPKMAATFAENFDAVVFDDSHAIKNAQAHVSAAAYEIAKRMKRRYCLTGTPYGTYLMNLFHQIRCMDLGHSFGDSWYWFREHNFFKYTPWEYRVKPSKEPWIMHVYHSNSIRFEEHECYDMPEKIFIEKEFELGPHQRKQYDKMVDGDVLESDFGEVISTENRFTKYRQVTSGGILQDDELVIDFDLYKENPKFDIAMDIITGVIHRTKVLVFHEFIFEAKKLEARLKKEKIRFAAMRGQIKDKDSEYMRFQHDESVRVMVAHPKSGGESFDFVNCSVLIFLSSPVDVITRKQCEKRISRQTQKSKRLWYYDLVGKRTIDQSILKTIKEGKDFHVRTLSRPRFNKIVWGEGL